MTRCGLMYLSHWICLKATWNVLTHNILSVSNEADIKNITLVIGRYIYSLLGFLLNKACQTMNLYRKNYHFTNPKQTKKSSDYRICTNDLPRLQDLHKNNFKLKLLSTYKFDKFFDGTMFILSEARLFQHLN